MPAGSPPQWEYLETGPEEEINAICNASRARPLLTVFGWEVRLGQEAWVPFSGSGDRLCASSDCEPEVISFRSQIPRSTLVLVALMIVVIPIMGIFDVIETFQGGAGLMYLETARGGGERVGKVFLYLREVLLFALVGVLFFWLCLAGRPLPRIPGVGFLLTCLGISFLVSVSSHPLIIGLVGLRQLTYPMLVYSLYYIARESDRIESIFVWVTIWVALVEFLLASIQLLLMAGTSIALFGARAYGTFNNPNSLGAVFAILVFVALFLGRLPRWVTVAMVVLCVVGGLMAASRAGLLATAFVFVAFGWGRLRKPDVRGMFLTASAVGAVLLFITVGIITGRGGGADATPLQDPRVKVFAEQIQGRGPAELLFGRGLGVGTNTLHALGLNAWELPGVVLIVDSLITSLVVQIGFLGLVAFAGVLAVLSARCGFVGWVLFWVTWLLGLGLNWLEFYPINLIVTSAYGLLWAKADRLRAAREEKVVERSAADAAQVCANEGS